MTERAFELDDMVDHITTFMHASDWEHHEHAFRQNKLGPKHFSRAEPFLTDPNDGTIETNESFQFLRYQGATAEVGFFSDARLSDLQDPLDVSWIVPYGEDHQSATGLGAIRARLLTLKETRGQVHRLMPFMADLSVVFIPNDEPASAHRFIVGSHNQTEWQVLPRTRDLEQTVQDVRGFVTSKMRMAMGIQFSRRYYWRVDLGYLGYPSISVPTDPLGAQEVFRLRDMPEGRSRRAALRHWVESHWRKTREDSSIETFVRQHLRGKTEFVWNGLKCVIRPSAYDLVVDMKAKQERERMAKAGTDRRGVAGA